MREFIGTTFPVAECDGTECFRSREEPESWTGVDAFVSLFQLPATHANLMAQSQGTGFAAIFEEWKQRGVIV